MTEFIEWLFMEVMPWTIIVCVGGTVAALLSSLLPDPKKKDRP